MIVCLDATPLALSSGGLPRYTRELMAALTAEFPEKRFVFSSDQAFLSDYPSLPTPKTWLQRRWWLYGAERVNAQAQVDVFHGTNFAIPYAAFRPTVMTVHDISPWLEPEWHGLAQRVRDHTPRMIGLATMVITPSEAVRKQVIERFEIAPSCIASTPLAAAAHFRPACSSTAAPYFVFVGTLEPRKNIRMMLEAWRAVRDRRGAGLKLAGRRRSDFPCIPEEPGLELLGEVPESALAGLYSNALASLYVSEYEGFGLPVLEAMQCGVPTIISRDAALVEVAGGAALAVSNARELTAAMLAMIDNLELRGDLAKRSLARARDFSWARTARLTFQVYEESLRRFGR